MPATSPAPDSSDRRDRLRWCAVVAGVALLVRALHLWLLRDSPLFAANMGDAAAYTAWAREIAAGSWLGDEIFYQAPLYPYFLAVVEVVLGEGTMAVRSVQIVLGATACGFLTAAGWRFFGRRAGITAGLILAFYMPAIFADTTIQKSVLDGFGLCALLWILGRTAAAPRERGSFALGLVLGALILSRENAGIFAAVLAPWLVLAAPARGLRRFAPALLFAAGIAAVLGPVAARNAWVGGGFHLTTSQLGPNFYIGNNPAADGTYGPLRAGRGDAKYERADAEAIAEAALGRPLSPAEVSRFFTGRAFDYITGQPADWLRLVGRKTVLAFNRVELVDTEDPYSHAESSPVLRVTGAVLHFGTLAPFAVWGVILTWGDRRRLAPLYGMFAAYALSLIAFYVVGRYRLPLAPFWILFAGAALARAPAFLRSAGPARIAATAAAGAAAAIFCNWPVVAIDQMRSVTHYNLGNEMAARDRPEAAIAEYRTAIRLYAGNALATHNLGVMLARAGDLAGARTQYERALEIRPGYADAHVNLARTLHETGSAEAAIEHFERGLRADPGRLDVAVELGAAYADVGRPRAARACFELVLRRDPRHAAARAALAELEEQGTVGRAVRGAPAGSICAGPADS